MQPGEILAVAPQRAGDLTGSLTRVDGCNEQRAEHVLPRTERLAERLALRKMRRDVSEHPRDVRRGFFFLQGLQRFVKGDA